MGRQPGLGVELLGGQRTDRIVVDGVCYVVSFRAKG
jgi:hypothetical protein